MIIYTVHIEDAMEGEVAVPTLAEAKRLRADCEHPDGTITRIEVLPAGQRLLLCRLFNREGFAKTQTEVMPHKLEREES